jgi:hypothetical protein
MRIADWDAIARRVHTVRTEPAGTGWVIDQGSLVIVLNEDGEPVALRWRDATGPGHKLMAWGAGVTLEWDE